MAYATTTIQTLGPGVFRKLRRELGITAFGANAIVLPPGTEWFNHYHHRQDELYFVHAGGGQGGYVERDGEMVDPADVERRRRFSDGDLSVIARSGRLLNPAAAASRTNRYRPVHGRE